MNKSFPAKVITCVGVSFLSLFLSAFTGCDNKETIVDVNTPDGGVEVTRDRETGEIQIDTEEN